MGLSIYLYEPVDIKDMDFEDAALKTLGLPHECRGEEIFECDLTHNLGQMAEFAGVYKCLWRPEELGIETAGQMIPHLEAGYSILTKNKKECMTHNPANGWGDYAHLVVAVERLLNACYETPNATIRVSR